MLAEAPRVIPAVVDEIVYQPRRNLSERALVRVIPFTANDQARIRAGARALLNARIPADLPPRFLVSACRYAMESGANVSVVSQLAVACLTKRPTAAQKTIAPVEVLPARKAA
jgi:hypothetical protein